MHSHTIRPNATKLSTDDLYIQGKVDVYFVREKNEPYRCCRQSVKLTNRIVAFQKETKTSSEGGRRPSERSSVIIYLYLLIYFSKEMRACIAN